MKLQFKHQKFQADAARAVVDVFRGQPYLTPTYMVDRGLSRAPVLAEEVVTGRRNEDIVTDLIFPKILENLHKVQDANQIRHASRI